MIDFIKIRVENTSHEVFLKNSKLTFAQLVSEKDGEVSKNKVAEYRGMKVILHTTGAITITGKLSQFNNKENDTYREIYAFQYEAVLLRFVGTFNIPLRNCTLLGLQMGANVTPINTAEEVLNSMVVHFRNEYKFSNPSCKVVNYKEYNIKILNLTAIYNLHDQLFRFEINLESARVIRKLGIYTLKDLSITDIQSNIAKYLFKSWNDSLVLNNDLDFFLHISKSEKCSDWATPEYWKELSMDNNVYRNKYSKELSKVKEMIFFNPDSFQCQTAEALREKLKIMLIALHSL